MPLLRKWETDRGTGLAAIWKVEEDESFFTHRVDVPTAIKNEKRRVEHLAGRYLLKYLYPHFPLAAIAPDAEAKPRLPGNALYFSISHSWPYVAVVVDERHEAGIDIQTWHPRIADISHKFLSPQEADLVGPDPQMLTLAWAAKEAAYKWNGRRGMEFIEDLPIQTFYGSGYTQITLLCHNMGQVAALKLYTLMEPDFALCMVSDVQNGTK
jgi:4'-phosphopantetheinyl transferase